MKKKMAVAMIVIALLSICGCAWSEDTLEDGEYYIYGVSSDFSRISKRTYALEFHTSNPTLIVQALMEQLQKTTPKSSDIPAIGEKMKTVTYQIEDRSATLYFDASYNDLTGIKEVLHRAAIVKTLCQINGIDQVEFYVDNQPLVDSTTKDAIGPMTDSDFIDDENENGDVSKETSKTMYFADATGKKLIAVPTKITYDSTIPISNLLVNELIKGPEAVSKLAGKSLKRTIPDNVVVNSVITRENVCYVDFSKEFLTPVADVDPEVTIYSVVNLLQQLSNVNRVQITIDGETVENYTEKVRLDTPYECNLDIVETLEDYNKRNNK